MDMFRIHGIPANPAPTPPHARTFGRRSMRRYGLRLMPNDAAGNGTNPERAGPHRDAAAAEVDQYFEEYFFE